jgi:hypothetical protein
MNTTTDTPMCSPLASFEQIVRNLRSTWILWHGLFDVDVVGSPEEQVEFNARQEAMNAISPHFFKYARWTMLNSVLGDSSRLADPLKSCGKDNLTLQRMFDDTEFGGRDALQYATEHALTEALTILESDGFRDLRNKALSHNDFEVARGDRRPDVEIHQVRMAVEWVTVFASRIRATRKGLAFDPTQSVRIDGADDSELLRDVQRLVRAIRVAHGQNTGMGLRSGTV